ncbi:MAG: 1,6-anhydro-N-acetylmuramyl-L-alanine amidase AmpD [Rhodocyclaceae bacterium]|nr:1,6-anhydro-N-acetylmuramyl-L-alanine amidase AmpD [Rhodocyclaceae bacterium]
MTLSSALRLDEQGWLTHVTKAPSPHHDRRPDGAQIELVVIHAISLPPGTFGGPEIIDFFCGRLDCATHPYFQTLIGLRVSAHFLVRRNGEVVQFVSCMDRAWHAGVSCWRGRQRCNDFSLGIELEGDERHTFTDCQYHVLAGLLRLLQEAYPIREIVGHHDIAPGRKTDPGPFFEWRRILIARSEASGIPLTKK